MSVGAGPLRNFYNKTLLRMHFGAFVGFMAGIKVCDLIFFDAQPYEELKEDMEDEFWAIHGEPKEIQPYLIPSIKIGKKKELRKSWIYIMYEKDQLIKKKDDID